MMSFVVRLSVMVLAVAVGAVVADPSRYAHYPPPCHPKVVTVTQVSTKVKEVPVFTTVVEVKTEVQTETVTKTEVQKIVKTVVAKPVYSHGHGHGHGYGHHGR